MKEILALALVTFIELARQKIVWLLVVLGLFLFALSVLFATLTFDEQLRILVHIGFTTVQLVLLALGLFVGGTAIHRELEKQTLFMVLARPLSRAQVYWGKFLGVMLLVGFFHVVLFAIHSYLVGKELHYFGRFIWAHLFLAAEAFCIASVAFSASMVFKPALAISLGFVTWIVGYWLEDLVYFAQRSKLVFYQVIAFISQYLVPRLHLGTELRGIYFLHEGTVVYWGVLHFIQISLFAWILLFLGELFFNKKDLT